MLSFLSWNDDASDPAFVHADNCVWFATDCNFLYFRKGVLQLPSETPTERIDEIRQRIAAEFGRLLHGAG